MTSRFKIGDRVVFLPIDGNTSALLMDSAGAIGSVTGVTAFHVDNRNYKNNYTREDVSYQVDFTGSKKAFRWSNSKVMLLSDFLQAEKYCTGRLISVCPSIPRYEFTYPDNEIGDMVGLRHIGYEIMGVMTGKAIVQMIEKDARRGDGYVEIDIPECVLKDTLRGINLQRRVSKYVLSWFGYCVV